MQNGFTSRSQLPNFYNFFKRELQRFWHSDNSYSDRYSLYSGKQTSPIFHLSSLKRDLHKTSFVHKLLRHHNFFFLIFYFRNDDFFPSLRYTFMIMIYTNSLHLKKFRSAILFLLNCIILKLLRLIVGLACTSYRTLTNRTAYIAHFYRWGTSVRCHLDLLIH